MKNKQNNLLTTGHGVSAAMETLTATSAPPALAARTALDNLLGEIKRLADAQANPLPPKTQERNEEINAASRAKQIAVALARRFLVDWWRVRTGRATCEELGLCFAPAK